MQGYDPNASLALVVAAGQIAAAIAVLNGLPVSVGQGGIAAKAVESVARQPEAKGSITSSMMIGMAMSETTGIYGLLISFLLLFANPLLTRFLENMV